MRRLLKHPHLMPYHRLIAAVLLVIALVLLVSHRDAHRTFGVAGVVALVGTVGLLSFI